MSTQENLLGRCIGVPGSPPCGRLIPDSDVNAVDTGNGMIASCCLSKLFPGVSAVPQTRSQFVGLKKQAGKKSAKIDANRFRIRSASNRRRVGIRLPGSRDFETEDRVAKKKRAPRKQVWGWEGK